ncbi:hypothetical protein Tco_1104338 [Tanacetum coccineum]
MIRFQQLLSQLEAHGAEVSTEDANHKFLRSLPSACSIRIRKEEFRLVDENKTACLALPKRSLQCFNCQATLVTLLGTVQPRGYHAGREERFSLSTSRRWEAREESDGFADNR